MFVVAVQVASWSWCCGAESSSGHGNEIEVGGLVAENDAMRVHAEESMRGVE